MVNVAISTVLSADTVRVLAHISDTVPSPGHSNTSNSTAFAVVGAIITVFRAYNMGISTVSSTGIIAHAMPELLLDTVITPIIRV